MSREAGEVHHVTVQIVKRSELHTFKVMPQRWIVERSFSWLYCSKDFEQVLRKYSEQMKLAVVEAYCSGQHEPSATAWLHNVRVSSLRKWISVYRVRRIARIRVKRRGVYNVEFKLAVVQRVRVSRPS